MSDQATSGFRAGFEHGAGDTAGPGLVRRVLVPNLGGVVALLLLPLVALGLPWLSWVAATVAWAINRIGHVVTLALVKGAPQTFAVGAAGIGMMFRIWIIAFGLVLVGADFHIGKLHLGAGDRDAALGAMVLFLILFTVDISVRILGELRRRAEELESRHTSTPAEEPTA